MSKFLKGLGCFVLIAALTLTFVGIQSRNNTLGATAIGEVRVNGYVLLRKGPGVNYGYVTSGRSKVTLSDGKNVTITAKNGSWYNVKFKLGTKVIKGYLLSSYVKVQTGVVRTSIKGTINVASTSLAKYANVHSVQVKINNKVLKLARSTNVKIISDKNVGKQKWYYVSYTKDKKKYKGYIPAASVKLTYKKGMPGKISQAMGTQITTTAAGTKKVIISNLPVSLAKNRQVTVYAEKLVKGVRYYKISSRVGAKTIKGFVPESAITFQLVKYEEPIKPPTVTAKPTPKPTPTPKVTATPKPSTASATAAPNESVSDSQFRKDLKSQGFPDSYINPLMTIHKKYPKWRFQAFKTGLSFNSAVAGENKVGLNLLPNSKSYDWKSVAAGAYNYKTDTFIPFDGKTWVTASEKAIRYYMDPRNFLTDTKIFQFELLKYSSGDQTQSGVENLLKNTPMYKKTFSYTSGGQTKSIRYSKAFMDAASQSKVSPYHLASRVKQEVVLSSTLMSSSVTGNVAGYKNIFNFYNIGANNSAGGGAVAKGLKWAKEGTSYNRPWTDRYRSIVGGAKYIGSKYINVGQNTLYLQKFNVTSKSRYNHQYMGNIEAPYNEAAKTVSAYGSTKSTDTIIFSIPVYSGLPANPCPKPSGGKNANNYLKSLYIKGYPFKKAFKLGDTGSKTYTVTLANNVSSVKIVATAINGSATVSGAGTKTVPVGTTTFTIKVKAANGSVRKYKVKVTRKAG